jgi:hypothetical protein
MEASEAAPYCIRGGFALVTTIELRANAEKMLKKPVNDLWLTEFFSFGIMKKQGLV